jgi:RNA polymerase sigma-70 factor (sigma-E family)
VARRREPHSAPRCNLSRLCGVLEREPTWEWTLDAEIAVEKRGRTSRLAQLYTAHAPRAGRLAYLLTGDPDVAEDLTQEAFTRLITRFGALRRPDAVDAYLRRSVVNLARKHWRRLGRERSYVRREGPVLADRTLNHPDVAERVALWKELDKLPYRQRAALVLRFFEDLSERETAESLGCPVGTVKSLVSRGLEALRQEIRGGDDA